MDFQTWYGNLIKPAWTPSPSTISLIWTILYPIILASLGFVIFQAIRRRLSWLVVLPFILNLMANILFMPIFGWMRNLPLATVDILIVWTTVGWMIAAMWRHDRWVALAQVPYMVWVSIATILQLQIMFRNG